MPATVERPLTDTDTFLKRNEEKDLLPGAESQAQALRRKLAEWEREVMAPRLRARFLGNRERDPKKTTVAEQP